jgi:hypothetical protein
MAPKKADIVSESSEDEDNLVVDSLQMLITKTNLTHDTVVSMSGTLEGMAKDIQELKAARAPSQAPLTPGTAGPYNQRSV